MNDEEKATYDALNSDEEMEGAYDELEDDFIFLANEGKAAVELIGDEPI